MRRYEKTMRFLEYFKGKKFTYSELDPAKCNMISGKEYLEIVDFGYRGKIKKRIRAICLLARLHEVPVKDIAYMLNISESTVNRNFKKFKKEGLPGFLRIKKCGPKSYKRKNPEFINAVFSILHSPPSAFGINRTTWRLEDIKNVMSDRGLIISTAYISNIVKDAGYTYRKSKTVLTSNDPEYREKLKKITNILSNLKPTEKFFSIDEFGPFAIKIKGGKSLVKKGHYKTIPQWQKSKGCLILTAALELSTNQVTHFYSPKKDTEEMIKLLEILLGEYINSETIYLSWDAASWHASKKLFERIDEINSSNEKFPIVKTAPLPSRAQFLNIIESIFSGMARAILHNSDYQSVIECQQAIDRYFEERNYAFKLNPKRAGNKIWGKERASPIFSEYNNCKDPRWR